ncbi:MAG TPA: hypothetical protein VJQ61_08135 [Sinomonas sp.]|nr:hypothetical protein [Sinomonas sp.]
MKRRGTRPANAQPSLVAAAAALDIPSEEESFDWPSVRAWKAALELRMREAEIAVILADLM